MLYSIIDTQKGEIAGFSPVAHVLIQNGEKMIVNENELRMIDDNIEYAAQTLGGEILTLAEVKNIKNKTK